MVAGVCGKHLKDENESICGKYHTKQIEKTPNREPHLSENRNLGSYVTFNSNIDNFKSICI